MLNILTENSMCWTSERRELHIYTQTHSPHLTLEQHSRLVGLVTVTQATVHTSQPVCVAAMGLNAQMFGIYTEWLMTQVRYLKSSIHWYHSIVNEVPQLVCVHRVYLEIWPWSPHSRQAPSFLPLAISGTRTGSPLFLNHVLNYSFDKMPPFYLCFVNEAVTFRCRWHQHSVLTLNWKW